MPPKKEPTALKPVLLAGIIVLLPVCFTIMIMGILGIQILMDTESKSFLSQTEFGRLYRKLTSVNPFFSAMFVNGGMIGTMFAITKLVEHRRAVKSAAAAPKEEVKAEATESKKEK
ncbi:hypothetical protein GPECTOR_17g816 [Gonium pectorale]|uniref:Uncharacterized protein n=1 Tax=Gonium pectorale TaxID=33097 RepID=A0A150GK16_GONPE|nr:hypothetical protein GPECTOR_17g816 [Gonium pectorale]|eukprot:KXZ50179.1 hypothetical protein GPECTOR_17g816 [Gonium pectorale]